MRKVYVLSGCEGSKKATDLLTEKSFNFVKKNLSFVKITESELIDISNLCPNGLIDIINPSSKKIQELGISEKYKNFSKLELMNLIMDNPDVISYPIVIQDNPNKKPKRLIIGFNPDEWTNHLYNDPNITTYYNNISSSYQFDGCCFYDKLKDGKESEFDINPDQTVSDEEFEKVLEEFLVKEDKEESEEEILEEN